MVSFEIELYLEPSRKDDDDDGGGGGGGVGDGGGGGGGGGDDDNCQLAELSVSCVTSTCRSDRIVKETQGKITQGDFGKKKERIFFLKDADLITVGRVSKCICWGGGGAVGMSG